MRRSQVAAQRRRRTLRPEADAMASAPPSSSRRLPWRQGLGTDRQSSTGCGDPVAARDRRVDGMSRICQDQRQDIRCIALERLGTSCATIRGCTGCSGAQSGVVHTRNLAAEAVVPAWAAGVPARIRGDTVGTCGTRPEAASLPPRAPPLSPVRHRYIALSRHLRSIWSSRSELPPIGSCRSTAGRHRDFRLVPAADSRLPLRCSGRMAGGNGGRMDAVKDR
jgi:hypothetical protein